MKRIILFTTLFLIPFSVLAHDHHHDYSEPNNTTIVQSSNDYSLLGMAAAGNVLDWGVPNKLQLSVAGAFAPGGDQAISFAAGTRLGGILLSGHLVTTLSGSDNDYAVIVGATGHF